MQTHQLKRKNKNKKAKRVGRGGKRGKTSGKGTKGQNARSGRKKRPEMRDIIKKLPKLRGHSFDSVRRRDLISVNLKTIDNKFKTGEVVNGESIFQKGIIRKSEGYIPMVKILADGEITKALNFENCLVSESAKIKIEKAGGKIELPKKKEIVPKEKKAPKTLKAQKPEKSKDSKKK